MSKNELAEQQLDEILNRYHLLYWKKSGLEELIKNAEKEKALWKARDNMRMTNDMTKIIEMAEILVSTKEEA